MGDTGQSRERRDAAERDHEPEQHDAVTPAEGSRELLDDVDELMDEIDEVLEENAEEFVRGYVQKGGQ